MRSFVIFLVFAGVWVGAMAGRLPRDLAEFRAGDREDRLAIGILWLATLGILGLAVRCASGVALRL